MENRIQINLGTDHALECTEKVIGRAGEGLVSKLVITVPEALRGFDAYIDFEKPNGETFRTPKLETAYGVVTYDVPQYLLIENGEIKVQLVFEKSNGTVWKSSKKRYTILKSINAVDDIPDKEDFITVAQRLIDELSQEVEDIADALANNRKFSQAVIDACGGQKKITTINNIPLRLFVGKKADFELEEKQNVFAIFTDDTARKEILEKIEQRETEHNTLVTELKNGSFKPYEAETAGYAEKALYDSAGNPIAFTYVKKDNIGEVLNNAVTIGKEAIDFSIGSISALYVTNQYLAHNTLQTGDTVTIPNEHNLAIRVTKDNSGTVTGVPISDTEKGMIITDNLGEIYHPVSGEWAVCCELPVDVGVGGRLLLIRRVS